MTEVNKSKRIANMADNTLCNNLNTIPIITDNTAITTTQICIGDLLINTKGPDHNLSNKEDAQDPQLVPLLVSRYFLLKDLCEIHNFKCIHYRIKIGMEIGSILHLNLKRLKKTLLPNPITTRINL